MSSTTVQATGRRAPGASDHGDREITSRPPAHGHVASHTPGRLRVRLHHPHRHPQLLNEVHKQLASQPGVDHVEVNPHSGSVLVHYDHQTRSMGDVLGCLRDVGVIIGSVAGADELPDVGGDEESGHSSTAAGVVGSINDLDQRISRMTGRKVDLKLLFPAALGAIGLQSALRNGIGFAEVPAYILIWYAFDSFWKFHSNAPAPAPAATSAPRSPASGQPGG
ncbi:MAG: hypothetical protein JO023_09655 [Chloroflexi bacterium]|nr:hypothetical protein [Chloroflexota bacterium]